MFKIAKVTGNGSPQVAFSVDANFEASMHTIYFNNSNVTSGVVTITVGTITATRTIQPGGETFGKTINVPAGNTVTITAPTGIEVMISYAEVAIDAGAALTLAQQTISSLPDGTVNDTTPSSSNVYSSSKVQTLVDTLGGDILLLDDELNSLTITVDGKVDKATPELNGPVSLNGDVGEAGQSPVSQGPGQPLVWQSPSSGVNPGFQEFTSSGTWTKPNDINFVYVEVIGGGASGGAIDSWNGDANGAGGGGGGGFSSILLVASTLPSSVTVTVGAGGSPVPVASVSPVNGNDGGDSSFGSYVIGRGGFGSIERDGGLSGNLDHAYDGSSSSPPRNVSIYGSAGGEGKENRVAAGYSMKGGCGGHGVYTPATSSKVYVTTNNTPVTTYQYVGGYGGASGDSGTDGGFPGGGGGAAGESGGISGSGGNGVVRVWYW